MNTCCDLRNALGGRLLAALLTACTTTPKPKEPPTPSYVITTPRSDSAGPAGRSAAPAHRRRAAQSGLFLLGQGVEAFSARVGLAQRATRTLDVQYYAVFNDESGTLLLGELIDAARRGVRVRLLIDDLHGSGQGLDLALLASVPGIEVRVFNPFAGRGFAPARLLEFIADGERLNRRMHNKAWIADNVGAIIGGRNLGNKYFSGPSETLFADLDVLTLGPVTREISRSFDRYWNSEWALPITRTRWRQQRDSARTSRRVRNRIEQIKASTYGVSLKKSDPVGDLLAGRRAIGLGDGACGGRSGIEVRRRQIAGSRKLCSNRGCRAAACDAAVAVDGIAVLRAGRERHELAEEPGRSRRQGARVDQLAECNRRAAGARRLRKISAGVAQTRCDAIRIEADRRAGNRRQSRIGNACTRNSEASLHAKAFVIDQRTVLIGSMNFDPRSAWYNSELGILVESPELAAQVVQAFDRVTSSDRVWKMALDENGLAWISTDTKDASTLRSEPASFWRRMQVELLGPLAPEGFM